MTRLLRTLFLLCALCLLWPHTSWAQAGKTSYFTTTNRLQANISGMGNEDVNSAPGGACGTAGQTEMNGTYLRYCNGTTWQILNQATGQGACGTPGLVEYTGFQMRYCAGGQWAHWHEVFVPIEEYKCMGGGNWVLTGDLCPVPSEDPACTDGDTFNYASDPICCENMPAAFKCTGPEP